MPKNSTKKMKYGDVVKLGDHILGCGDSADAVFVNRLVGNRTIDTVICDVPYGIAYTDSKKGFAKIKVPKKILNDHLASDEEYAAFTKRWLDAIVPHLAKKNSIYIFNSDLMIFALREGMRDADVKFSQLLIWIKNHSVIGRKDYLPQHELVAYGWHGTHTFQKAKDKSILVEPKPNKSPLHPTQKPVALIRRLILNSTKLGGTVYDGFSGSGTLGIAAEQAKRKAIMIERDEAYCASVVERFAKTFGIKAEPIKNKK